VIRLWIAVKITACTARRAW